MTLRLLKIFSIAFILILIIAPIYIIIKYSMSDIGSINMGGGIIPLWPNSWTLKSYFYFLKDEPFRNVIYNSLSISFLTVLLSILLGVPASYILAKLTWKPRIILLTALLSIRLFPDVSSVIAVTQIFIKLNIHNTRIGVALAHTLLSLPYVIFICTGVFSSIPKDLDEQARVLGASKLFSFIHVILPLAIPGIVVAGIYTFLLSWNEFIFSYFLLYSGSINTITVYLKKQLSYSPPQNLLATISVFLSLPVIIFTLLIQKHIKQGVTAGSIK